MKSTSKILSLILVLTLSQIIIASPPYWGTIFIEANVVTQDDPSAYDSVSYVGIESVTMFDRRSNNWVTGDAYIFNIIFNDSLSTKAQINSEFGSIDSAKYQAEKYGFLVGQLPHCLRLDVDELWIHKGTEAFGGGNRSILIHTGQTALYEVDGIIEETLIHEACHTSLDEYHAEDPNWINAQNMDDKFISTYAQDNPTREDIAESFLPWIMVRHKADRMNQSDMDTILQSIPNRLNYFDSIECNLYPYITIPTQIPENSFKFEIYPNPSSGQFDFILQDLNATVDIEIYNIKGQIVEKYKSVNAGKTRIQIKDKTGIYFMKVKSDTKGILTRKIIVQ